MNLLNLFQKSSAVPVGEYACLNCKSILKKICCGRRWFFSCDKCGKIFSEAEVERRAE